MKKNKTSNISDNIIVSPDVNKTNRIPPHQRLVTNFPILHYKGIPKFNKDKWTFRIWGQVEKKRRLNYDEFINLPQIQIHADMHYVTGWSKLDNLWQGISTQEIKNLVTLKSSANYVMVYGADDYYTNLSLLDFLGEDVLFALKYNNQDITPEHGYPLRLVVPRLYLWKSAKWAVGIQFIDKDTPGFWESRGYNNHSDPWLEERYS